MQTTVDARQPFTGWHVRDWSALGWLETAAKVAGIGAAVIGVATMTASAIGVSGLGYGLAAVAGLLTLGAVVQLALRVKQKELSSLAFAVVNLIGHASLLWVVLQAAAANWVPVAFGGAYLTGELIKQRFLAVSGYTENGQSPAEMRRLSRIMAAMQVVLIVLALLR